MVKKKKPHNTDKPSVFVLDAVKCWCACDRCTLIGFQKKKNWALKRYLGYGKVHNRKVRGHSEDAWSNAADTLAGLGRDQGGANNDQKTQAVRLAM